MVVVVNDKAHVVYASSAPNVTSQVDMELYAVEMVVKKCRVYGSPGGGRGRFKLDKIMVFELVSEVG